MSDSASKSITGSETMLYTYPTLEFSCFKPRKSRLTIVQPAQFVIEFSTEKPNWWNRLWYKLLLDWKWEDV